MKDLFLEGKASELFICKTSRQDIKLHNGGAGVQIHKDNPGLPSNSAWPWLNSLT